MMKLGLEHGTDVKGEPSVLYEGVGGKWKWQVYGEKGHVETGSGAIFDDLETCKNHARRRGMDGRDIRLFKVRAWK